MRFVRAGALSILLLLIGYAFLPSAADVAQSPFLFMEDVRVGMEGVGKTTIRGNEVRSFQTRVVGLVDNPGTLSDYILIRSSGELIREAGGYAQGMSGSPVYINDELAGAFFAAFLFNDSPNPIGLVRPIEAMLELVNLNERGEDEGGEGTTSDEQKNGGQGTSDWDLHPWGDSHTHVSTTPSNEELREALTGVRFEGGKPERIEFVATPPSLEKRQAHPDTLYAVRSATPLWIAGLRGRALEWLERGVDPEVLEEHKGLISEPFSRRASRSLLEDLRIGLDQRFGTKIFPLASGRRAGAQADFPAAFEAGRPMGALLTQGDVTIGSICTTTFVDPQADVLLACGHQLFLTGQSNLFLTQARVIDTVNSGQISFVLPEVDREQVSGTVLQDRVQAISASLGREPESIKLRAHLRDRTAEVSREFSVDLADVGNFLPSLAFSALLQAVDTTLNRIGQGTMRIDYTIRGQNLPAKLTRTDVFTHTSDVAVPGPLQIAQVISLLHQNPFVNPSIERIDVDIEVERPIRLRQVQSIKTDKEEYQPGETVRYAIQLQTYRGPERALTGSFQLPEDVKERKLTLHAFGGPRRKQQQQNQNGSQIPDFDELGQLIQAIERSTANDQITVELLGLSRDGKGEDDESDFQDVQRLGSWVVTGEERVTIEIQPPKPEPAPEEEEEEQQEDECDELFYC